MAPNVAWLIHHFLRWGPHQLNLILSPSDENLLKEFFRLIIQNIVVKQKSRTFMALTSDAANLWLRAVSARQQMSPGVCRVDTAKFFLKKKGWAFFNVV